MGEDGKEHAHAEFHEGFDSRGVRYGDTGRGL